MAKVECPVFHREFVFVERAVLASKLVHQVLDEGAGNHGVDGVVVAAVVPKIKNASENVGHLKIYLSLLPRVTYKWGKGLQLYFSFLLKALFKLAGYAKNRTKDDGLLLIFTICIKVDKVYKTVWVLRKN